MATWLRHSMPGLSFRVRGESQPCGMPAFSLAGGLAFFKAGPAAFINSAYKSTYGRTFLHRPETRWSDNGLVWICRD